jgi:outer membrane immunogenic protein
MFSGAAMKKVLFGFLAISVFMAVPALAADMAVKAPPQPVAAPAPVYRWTGFYIGGNAGYGWKDPTVAFTPNDSIASYLTGGFGGGTSPAPASFGIGGGLGGGQAGYNWQTNQVWLIGIETDFDWTGIRGTGTASFNFPLILASSPSNFVVNQKVQWFGTVRGRLGWTPTNSMLLYGTAGFAYGRVSENAVLNTGTPGLSDAIPPFGFRCVTGPNCYVGNSSRTATGWTAGGGIEYAVWQNLSVKAEFLYVDLGRGDTVRVTAVNGGGFAPSSFTATFSRLDFYVARGGVNWKF